MTTQDASALATRLAESITDRWSLSTMNRYGEEYFPSLTEVAEAIISHLQEYSSSDEFKHAYECQMSIAEGLNEENAALRALVDRMNGQMKKVRRFLPSHGSFGEEGISDYEKAIEEADKVTAP